MDSHLQLVPDIALTAGGPIPSPIRVVVADDHELVRRGMCLVLAGELDVEVVAEADDLASTILAVHGHRPDVLVLDLRIRGGSAGEAIRRLRETTPATRIVALSMNASRAFADYAIASGASGFVLKDLADSELVPAIRAAVSRRSYMSPHLAAAAG
jgi:two-component system response regulator NreC